MSETQFDADGKVHVSATQKRFDRQLRLWGAHGQDELNNARLCCFGTGATATETLKNLVLPSIGTITLVDNHKVDATDLSNNFFVRRDTMGQDRATVTAAHLKVLNPSVEFKTDLRAPTDLVKNAISEIAKDNFDFVLDTCLPEASARVVAAKCWSANIPFMRLQVNGLLGYIRLATQEIEVVETHDDADRRDVFVHPDQVAAWPEYKTYLESFNLFDLDKETDEGKRQHKHVPYVAVLHQMLAKWAAMPDEQGVPQGIPAGFKKKKAFKAWIKAQKFQTFEDNFKEALASAHRACAVPELDGLVQDVYDDAKAQNLTPESGLFWICVRALNDWKASDGRGFMPVSTNIPDMTCFTENYTLLKEIFQRKADLDCAAISARVQTYCNQYSVAFNAEYVQRFVKHSRELGMQRTSAFESEFTSNAETKEATRDVIDDALGEYIDDFDRKVRPVDVNWYFAFRAGHAFHQKHNRHPGTVDGEEANDTKELTSLGQQIATDLKLENSLDNRVFGEFVRYGDSEPHNIAAFVGGIASQEVLKVIMKQFVPIQNTVIVNGVHCSVSTYKL